MKNVAAMLAAALMLTGCLATTQRMADADRAKYKSARLDERIEKKQLFLLAPGGANAGLMFGALGGAAASGAINDARTAFLAYLDKNQISIEKIVREELEPALRTRIAIVPAGDAAAPLIKITINQYGFGVPHLGSSNVVPTVAIQCDMTDAAGKVIWRGGDYTTTLGNPIPAMNWEEMVADPRRVEEQLRKAVRHLSGKIAETL